MHSQDDHFNRYQRQMILPGIGVEGQRKLVSSSVLIVGAGGLGSPSALYLAAAGVGRIGLVDDDVVEMSNLHRQILHGTASAGSRKVDSARERLADLNPQVKVEAHPVRLNRTNAADLIAAYDLVVEGSDNLATREVVNEVCVAQGKPWIYGAVHRFEGQCGVFVVRGSGCYRCLFPGEALAVANCAEAGVLGVLPGVVGTLQATEALKLLLGMGDLLVNRLLIFDALEAKFRALNWQRNPNCPVCGEAAVTDEKRNEESTMQEMTVHELKQRLDAGHDLQVLDVREPKELEVCRLPGTLDIPLGEVLERAGEIDSSRETVVMCLAGGRSAKAIMALKAAGYPGKLINLTGGIQAWVNEVDPSIVKR
jgi:molybdopterin/thiamine biosynthesis adenylyltransferase/rhodanese-related sulfurtransferase